MSWVRFPAAAGLFTFLYFTICNYNHTLTDGRTNRKWHITPSAINKDRRQYTHSSIDQDAIENVGWVNMEVHHQEDHDDGPDAQEKEGKWDKQELGVCRMES